MRNQQLIRQGFGSFRLLLGLLYLFVIWQQCRGFDPVPNPTCPEPNKKLNCKYDSYKVKINGCDQYYCYQGLKDKCASPYKNCTPDLQCVCGECMNCVNDVTYHCNVDVCRGTFSLAKRLPLRLPPSWYYRSRWQNLLQKFALEEPKYDDDTTQYIDRFWN